MDSTNEATSPAVVEYMENHRVTREIAEEVMKRSSGLNPSKRNKTIERNIAQNAYANAHWRIKA